MIDRRPGFTLLELTVALGILALLAAGLLRILAGGLWGLGRAANGLAAQRSLRRALDELSQDVLEAGFRVPLPGAAPTGPLLRVRRDRPLGALGLRPPGAGGGGGSTDELTLIKDEVLHPEGELAAPIPREDPAPLARWVRVQVREGLRLRPGDLVVVEDDHWEGWRLERAQLLPPGSPGDLLVAPLGEAGPRGHHARGAPVRFVRPLRWVRYALVTAPEGGRHPVLARFETSLATEKASKRALLEGHRGPGDSLRIVAEHLTAFRVTLPGGSGESLPPRVVLTLEACGPGGRSPRARTRVLAPRLGPGP